MSEVVDTVTEKMLDPTTYRKVIGGFATGVSVITTEIDGIRHGMTANSLTSVSLDPLLLLVCFDRDSRTAQAALQRGAFLVNLLSEEQQDLADRFARAGADHFAGLELEPGYDGLPALPGGLGWLACEVDNVHSGGDHIIAVARVVSAEAREGEPLLFFRGRYGRRRREA
jgi:flavin reductase (DIM6/NTAB) family NADH-FMN oxidoreductase RutF